MSVNAYDEIRGLVITLVATERANGQIATSDSIAEKIDAIMGMYVNLRGPAFTDAVDPEAMQRDIESSFNVFMANANVMVDDSDHEAWLEAAREDIDWRFWKRYRQYQLAANRMPPDAVDRL